MARLVSTDVEVTERFGRHDQRDPRMLTGTPAQTAQRLLAEISSRRDGDVQDRCCREITHLVSLHKAEGAEAVLQVGMIPYLVNILDIVPDDRVVQSAALGAIHAVLENGGPHSEDIVVMLHGSDFVRAATAALSRAPQAKFVHRDGGEALALYFRVGGPDAARAAAGVALPGVLVASLRENSGEVAAQMGSCAALAAMLATGEQVSGRMAVEEGVAEALKSAVAENPKEARMAELGLAALRSICQLGETESVRSVGAGDVAKRFRGATQPLGVKTESRALLRELGLESEPSKGRWLKCWPD